MTRSLPILAGCSVLLAVLLVAAKFTCEHRLAPLTSGIQGELAAAPVDVLFVGSSHTRQSYDVHALEKSLHGSAFLVAYNGLDYQTMTVIVPALLANGKGPPKVLVIEGYCMSLVRSGGLEDSRMFFDAPPAMKVEFMRQYLAEGATWERYLDLFDLAVNRDNELLLMHPAYSRLTSWLSYRGGYAGKNVPGLSSFDGIYLRVPRSSASPEQEAALISVIQAAKQQNVRVLCIESPMPGPTERQGTVIRLKARLAQILREQDVPYLDGASGFPVDDPKLFGDSNHLSTEGRALFTEIAARFIAQTQQPDIAAGRKNGVSTALAAP
ncbi:MAG TPA: hypothetical protein VNU49_07885 [Opitutaceae bacterium]|jgi:hypothetical protein|nr:hypothetical protein [Opitutaceae bacterium]